ncbi:MAG TPA: multidrug efflux SMR transporter [Chthoniobacterales bacterium]|jgi:quaternary ammonium compound-resistance protein SugE
MAWFYLFVAGVLEIGWSIGLKYTHGFTRPVATAFTLAAMVASVVFLAQAVRTLPLGSSYAIWAGIGTIGTAIVGVVAFGDALTLARAACLLAIGGGIVGLKLAT